MELLVSSYDGFVDGASASHKDPAAYFPVSFPTPTPYALTGTGTGDCSPNETLCAEASCLTGSTTEDAAGKFRLTSMTTALLAALAQNSEQLLQQKDRTASDSRMAANARCFPEDQQWKGLQGFGRASVPLSPSPDMSTAVVPRPEAPEDTFCSHLQRHDSTEATLQACDARFCLEPLLSIGDKIDVGIATSSAAIRNQSETSLCLKKNVGGSNEGYTESPKSDTVSESATAGIISPRLASAAEASAQLLNGKMFWQTPPKDAVARNGGPRSYLAESTNGAVVAHQSPPDATSAPRMDLFFWDKEYSSSDWRQNIGNGALYSDLLSDTPPQLTFPRRALQNCHEDEAPLGTELGRAKPTSHSGEDVEHVRGDATPGISVVEFGQNATRSNSSMVRGSSADTNRSATKARPGPIEKASRSKIGCHSARGLNNTSETFIAPVQTSRKIQYKKTKPCPWNALGKCVMGERCNYAHSEAELRGRPDLTHTRLCPNGTSCSVRSCRFAHEACQLRATGAFYRTKLCKFWLKGSCPTESRCRHAHGESELRHPESVSEVSKTEGQKESTKQNANSLSPSTAWTCDDGSGNAPNCCASVLAHPIDPALCHSHSTTSEASSVVRSGLRKSESEATQVSLESNPKSTKQSPPNVARKAGSDSWRRPSNDRRQAQQEHETQPYHRRPLQPNQEHQRRVCLEAPVCKEADVLKHINRRASAFPVAGVKPDLVADRMKRSPAISLLSAGDTTTTTTTDCFSVGRFEGATNLYMPRPCTHGNLSSTGSVESAGLLQGSGVEARQPQLVASRNGVATTGHNECQTRKLQMFGVAAERGTRRSTGTITPHYHNSHNSSSRGAQDELVSGRYTMSTRSVLPAPITSGSGSFPDGEATLMLRDKTTANCCKPFGPVARDLKSPQWQHLSLTSSGGTVPVSFGRFSNNLDLSLDFERYAGTAAPDVAPTSNVACGEARNPLKLAMGGSEVNNLKLEDIIQLAVSSQDPDLLECSAKILRASLWLKRKQVE